MISSLNAAVYHIIVQKGCRMEHFDNCCDFDVQRSWNTKQSAGQQYERSAEHFTVPVFEVIYKMTEPAIEAGNLVLKKLAGLSKFVGYHSATGGGRVLPSHIILTGHERNRRISHLEVW